MRARPSGLAALLLQAWRRGSLVRIRLHRLGERLIVIPFLVVTSILNIAVGYALAVYLGKATLFTATDESAAANEVLEPHRTYMQFAAPVMIEPTRSETPASQSVADASDTTQAPRTQVEAHAESPYVRSEVLEQELLAGIEEFRNQLSQLKGAGVPGVFLDPLTAK
jgi:hypothetical protein